MFLLRFISDVTLLINNCLKKFSKKLNNDFELQNKQNFDKNLIDIENKAIEVDLHEQNLFNDLSDPFQKLQNLNLIHNFANKQEANATNLNKINKLNINQTIDSDIFEHLNDKKGNNTLILENDLVLNNSISVNNNKTYLFLNEFNNSKLTKFEQNVNNNHKLLQLDQVN